MSLVFGRCLAYYFAFGYGIVLLWEGGVGSIRSTLKQVSAFLDGVP